MNVSVSYPKPKSDYAVRDTIAVPSGSVSGVVVKSDSPVEASLDDIMYRWREFGFIDVDHLQMLFEMALLHDSLSDSPIAELRDFSARVAENA